MEIAYQEEKVPCADKDKAYSVKLVTQVCEKLDQRRVRSTLALVAAVGSNRLCNRK